jgi:hypothetical protein
VLAHHLAKVLEIGVRQGAISSTMHVTELAARLGNMEPSARDPFWTVMCGMCGSVGTPVGGSNLTCKNEVCENTREWVPMKS